MAEWKRHNGKKYNKRKSRNSGRGLIPGRVDIDQRPAIVAAKSRIGDWEADTIIGAKHKGADSRPRKILGYKTPHEVFFNVKNPRVALHCWMGEF
jgi:IS30 family transposase